MRKVDDHATDERSIQHLPAKSSDAALSNAVCRTGNGVVEEMREPEDAHAGISKLIDSRDVIARGLCPLHGKQGPDTPPAGRLGQQLSQGVGILRKNQSAC